jgi:hypothetical protein
MTDLGILAIYLRYPWQLVRRLAEIVDIGIHALVERT